MNEIDAVGSMVEGGLAARVIEPRAGEPGPDGHTHETNCLNCGTLLTGPYCSACGQHGHVHRTIGAFFHDLAHGVLHVEGKTWRTLPLLAWRPGELTRRYVEGQRASFVSPMALFLFSVFLMFAVVSTLAPIQFGGDKAVTGLGESIASDRAAIVRLQQERAALIASKQPTTAIDARIQDHGDELRLLETMKDKGFVKGTAVRISSNLPAWLRDRGQRAADNPDLTLYKLKSGAYKWSWALIPLSVPFLWLLFPFSRRFKLYDHTVFVTYSLSFMSMMVVALTLWSAIGLPGVAVAALLIPPVHMYRQLKGAYGLTRVGAVMRAVALVLFSMFVLSLFLTIMLAVGVFD